MMESLAYEVEKIDLLQKTAEDIKPLLNDKKLAKQLNIESYVKEIEALRSTLVVTKGDNYVGAADPQLREKIAKLYGEVIGYAGKPSNAQLSNLNLLTTRLNEAKGKINAVIQKAEVLNNILDKAKIEKRILARLNDGA